MTYLQIILNSNTLFTKQNDLFEQDSLLFGQNSLLSVLKETQFDKLCSNLLLKTSICEAVGALKWISV